MSCKIRVMPRGKEFTAEADESILDAALRHGHNLPYGCRNGACGACKGRLLEGEVRYAEEPMALTEEERADGWALLCVAVPGGDVTVQTGTLDEEAIPVRTMPAKVVRMTRLSEDVMQLLVKLPESERLRYRAGQYVDFLLAQGKRRAFSIANPPHEDALLEFHIKRIDGGRFTEHVFSEMSEKELLRIEGPHGSFYLREDSDRPIIMLATGTGFGPVKAIVEHAIAEGSTRPIHLYWGARSRDGLYMDALVRGWSEHHPHIHYIPVLSRPDADWQGRTGHVQDIALADFDDLRDFEVYACGHPAMVYAAKRLMMEKGLDPEHCFSDAFEWAKD